MIAPDLYALAERVVSTYATENLKLVTAESCTGGLISGTITEIPGASAVLERGFVSYSNEAKIEVLGVPPDVLERFGAVSAETAEEMAKGALDFSLADVALSVTGIAGPDGGTETKPVGLVYIGLATRRGTLMHYQCRFSGDRDSIRMQTVFEALRLALSAAGWQ